MYENHKFFHSEREINSTDFVFKIRFDTDVIFYVRLPVVLVILGNGLMLVTRIPCWERTSRLALHVRHFCGLPGPEVIKQNSCSTQLRLKFILLINVKIGILTFISRINYYLMGFMPECSTDLNYFSIYELLKIHAQSAELSMKKSFITSGPVSSLGFQI